MSVKLRIKACVGGKKSFYLDIYHDNKRHYEFLKLYLLKGTSAEQRQKNDEIKLIAESIRSKRELELQNKENVPKFRRSLDFLNYYEKFVKGYSNKDIRIVTCSFNHFKEFLISKGFESLKTSLITEDLCRDYREYLETVVNGETICNYFSKFRKVISQAFEDNLIKKDFAKKINNTKEEGLKKQILNPEEIQLLAKASCSNDNVKRAFLFSLNTGLRFAEIQVLKWSNISNNELILFQEKTKINLRIDLNNTSMKLVGWRGGIEDNIFKLPSHTACLKDLKAWIKKAGIEKHITWDCARHSFAVNLLDPDIVGADIRTVSSLLGHKSLVNTERYINFIEQNKKEAISKLPEFEI
jgi:site-specific recombinase XerD